MTTEEKIENRNRVVRVMKKEYLGRKCIPAEETTGDPYGGVCDQIVDCWSPEFHAIEMTYEDLCRDLGFDPDVRFVEVTRAGSITYTIGKPEEIHALWAAVSERGYKRKSTGRKTKGD